jgi:hypothetical protein
MLIQGEHVQTNAKKYNSSERDTELERGKSMQFEPDSSGRHRLHRQVQLQLDEGGHLGRRRGAAVAEGHRDRRHHVVRQHEGEQEQPDPDQWVCCGCNVEETAHAWTQRALIKDEIAAGFFNPYINNRAGQLGEPRCQLVRRRF